MIYIIIIMLIVLVEAVIKNHMDARLAHGEEKYILNGKIILKKVYNKGMMLNFLENKVHFVKKFTCILLGFVIITFVFLLPKRGNHLLKLALSLSLGGAISNVYDRIHKGHVVDYFSFNYKKLKSVVFNLADICIFIGSFMMLLASLFHGKSISCINKSFK